MGQPSTICTSKKRISRCCVAAADCRICFTWKIRHIEKMGSTYLLHSTAGWLEYQTWNAHSVVFLFGLDERLEPNHLNQVPQKLFWEGFTVTGFDTSVTEVSTVWWMWNIVEHRHLARTISSIQKHGSPVGEYVMFSPFTIPFPMMEASLFCRPSIRGWFTLLHAHST